MLPIFPNFKKIELTDIEALEKFTKQFPPYNDFDFVSLWTYNTDGNNSFSILNDNLVIKIQDFVTGIFFYSFIGINNINQTIETLLSKCEEENMTPQIRLIPEVNFGSSTNIQQLFSVDEDRDSFDYILSVDEIVNLEGSKYHDKRNLANKFKSLYPNHIVKILDLKEEKTRLEVEALFLFWEKQKNKDSADTLIEQTAIKKLFQLSTFLQMIMIGIYNENKLIGFSAFHIVNERYAILSFEKGDISYYSIYVCLNQEVARYLKSKNILYINYEQDLGIEGLRKAKMLWRPVHFLKKYTIYKK